MASDSHSFIFPILQTEIPNRHLVLEDPEATELLERYDGSPYFFYSSNRGAFVESWIISNTERLSGLSYFNSTSTTINKEQIISALESIELAFTIIEELGKEKWDRMFSYPASKAVHDTDEELFRGLPEDGEAPAYLIFCLREHRRVLSHALNSTGYAQFISYNPYLESA